MLTGAAFDSVRKLSALGPSPKLEIYLLIVCYPDKRHIITLL